MSSFFKKFRFLAAYQILLKTGFASIYQTTPNLFSPMILSKLDFVHHGVIRDSVTNLFSFYIYLLHTHSHAGKKQIPFFYGLPAVVSCSRTLASTLNLNGSIITCSKCIRNSKFVWTILSFKDRIEYVTSHLCFISLEPALKLLFMQLLLLALIIVTLSLLKFLHLLLILHSASPISFSFCIDERAFSVIASKL